jgi:hypothetical protein
LAAAISRRGMPQADFDRVMAIISDNIDLTGLF